MLWAGTRYNMSVLNDSLPSLQLINVTVNASRHVRVLGVHLFFGSESRQTRFQCQRELLLLSSSTRRIRRSLDTDSAATLVQTFMPSWRRVSIIAMQSSPRLRRQHRVLNAAARVISDIKKFDQGLSRLMHQDIPERVKYKLGVLTHQCLLGKAPVYLSNCCIPVSQVATRRQLRSAARHQLTVPRHHFSTYGRRSFAVAGPTMFNNLPDDLRDPEVSTTTFGSRWRHIFSLPISTFNTLGVSHVMRYINARYLLTYFMVCCIISITVYDNTGSVV